MLNSKNKTFIYSMLALVIAIALISFVYLNSITKVNLTAIDSKDKLNKISNEFIYFGEESSTKCNEFKPILEEVLLQNDLKVSYFDIDYFKKNSLMTEQEIKDLLSKYNITSIPALIKVGVDGNLEKSLVIDDNQNIKEVVREFLTFKYFPEKFIPHYMVEVVLFVLTIVILLLRFIFRDDKLFNSIMILTSLIIIISIALSVSLSMKYIDLYSLSGNSTMFHIYISTLILNAVSIVLSIYHIVKRKRV